MKLCPVESLHNESLFLTFTEHFYMPGTVLSALQTTFYIILLTNLWGKNEHHHFTGEDFEIYRD